MNANWIFNMLLRRFIGRALRFGVNAGLRRLSGGKGTPPGARPSKQARDAERARIRGLRLARRGMRGPKL